MPPALLLHPISLYIPCVDHMTEWAAISAHRAFTLKIHIMQQLLLLPAFKFPVARFGGGTRCSR
jgi:hypothetical protein